MSKKVQYTLEFPVKCSPGILYGFLSTPAGLQEWFADKVDFRDNVFSFSWNGSVEKAELLEKQEAEYVRMRWTTGPKDEFFEFRIQISEVTSETILLVKDFAEKREIADQSQLWNYQVKDLFHRIGSNN
ncbi:MAG TPA: START-like domain-containing protein [Chitinophagaceae bacterium]